MIPHDFHFLRPGWLAALLLLVPLLWWAWRRPGHAAGWERVCEPHLLRHLLTTPGRQSLRWPFALFAIGWTAACIALAGPTWERLPQTAFKEPARTVFVLGLSPSMNQRDVAPSRLARARHKLLDALDQQKGGSFALVLYREEAYAASPLTDDAEVLREMIPLLDTTLTPGRQVHPARGLETAAELLEPVGLSGARILLVTDGADDDPARTRRVARELASRGAHLSVLSIAGTDASLAALASEGNGNLAVLTADGSDLAKLFDGRGIDFGSSLARSEIKTDEWRDMGAWLVWIPLLLAPLAFRKGWASAILLVAFLQIPTSPAEAGLRDWFERPDQRASRAFEAEDYETAARNFEDPAWQAAAHYRAGDYESAARALEGRTDPVSAYNRANALAR
ncbi:MAG TPA: VWA domain-containing protein, partial [Deltaproteobacteria bacterium]|nr:VWA domain-containing protein [Deltaproteobacteria bacterium]